MLNSLISYNLGVFQYQNNGVWYTRVLTCSLEDYDLIGIKDLVSLLRYCCSNKRMINCYDYKGLVGQYPILDDSLIKLTCYKMHKLRTQSRLEEVLNGGSSQFDCANYSNSTIKHSGRPLCRFTPNVVGKFSIVGNMIVYNGEKKVFILPTDNYRHIDVIFYNKIFVNLSTGEIVGRYSGLDTNKQYVETEEYWDDSLGRWIVSKQRTTHIAGYKTVL